MSLLRQFFLTCLLSFSSLGLLAQTGAPQAVSLSALPAGKAVLTVKGTNGVRQFSIAELENLGTYRLSTKTFWPADDGIYEGVLLSTILKQAGIENSAAIRVRARDGFSQIIPHQDWEKWPILLATRRSGNAIPTRDKGPLRIIYPRDMAPELADSLYRLRWVWLVDLIEPAGQ